MRILLDRNTPAPLRYALRGRRVETAYERGWAEPLNGDLIVEAESIEGSARRGAKHLKQLGNIVEMNSFFIHIKYLFST